MAVNSTVIQQNGVGINDTNQLNLNLNQMPPIQTLEISAHSHVSESNTQSEKTVEQTKQFKEETKASAEITNVQTTTQTQISTLPQYKTSIIDKLGSGGYTPQPQAKPLYRVAVGTNVYVSPGSGNYVSGSPVFIERGTAILDANTNQKINHDLPPNTLIDVANGTPILLWNGVPAKDSKTGSDAVVTADVYGYEVPTKQQLTTYYVASNSNTNANNNTGIDWFDFWLSYEYVDSCHRCNRHGCHGYCDYYGNNYHHHYHTWHQHHSYHHYGHHGFNHTGYVGHHGHAHQNNCCIEDCAKGIFHCFKTICSEGYKGAKCCCGQCWECTTSKDGCLDQCGKALCECGKACGQTCGTCIEKTPDCIDATGKCLSQCGTVLFSCASSCCRTMSNIRVEDAGRICDACGEIGKCCCEVLECLTKLK